MIQVKILKHDEADYKYLTQNIHAKIMKERKKYKAKFCHCHMSLACKRKVSDAETLCCVLQSEALYQLLSIGSTQEGLSRHD